MENNPSNEVYARIIGPIRWELVYRLAVLLDGFATSKVDRFHLSIHSEGGAAKDGIELFSIFRDSPAPLILYNTGSVESAAAVAFLGAEHRVASRYSTFMFHRTRMGMVDATSDILHQAAINLREEDGRIEEILKSCVSFDASMWNKMQTGNLYISPDCAVSHGIAHDVQEFRPPRGSRIFVI